jgi:hypothetical protein
LQGFFYMVCEFYVVFADSERTGRVVVSDDYRSSHAVERQACQWTDAHLGLLK